MSTPTLAYSRVLVPLCAGPYQAHQQNRPERGVRSDRDVQNVVQCLVSLPLLPPEEIVAAIDDVEAHVLVDS